MYTEITPTGFSLQELTKTELDLLAEGLVVLKSEKLKDEEKRHLCIKMHQSITKELSKNE